MKAYNVTTRDLEVAAAGVGLTLRDVEERGARRPHVKFRLALSGPTASARWHRRSHHGRLVPAVCWHGHYAFFRMLLQLCPGAEIHTMAARYTFDNFVREAIPTGFRNIGSQARPMQYREACDCVDNGDFILDESPLVACDFEVKQITGSDIVKATDPTTCGSCGRTWDDAVITSMTPTPSGRCPFEWYH